MALGALTLPSVSTGFSSDSKAMVPVSIQGMADKVQSMSPIESMEEVFFDVRDGIVNLKETFIPFFIFFVFFINISLYFL